MNTARRFAAGGGGAGLLAVVDVSDGGLAGVEVLVASFGCVVCAAVAGGGAVETGCAGGRGSLGCPAPHAESSKVAATRPVCVVLSSNFGAPPVIE